MNDWPELRTIRLMADYECHPLWLSGPQVGDIAPDDPRLGLSSKLAERLSEWVDEYGGAGCSAGSRAGSHVDGDIPRWADRS